MANDRRPPRRPTAHQRRQRRREAAARTARGEADAHAERASGRTPSTGDRSAGPFQQRLAAWSHPLLMRLHALPGWVVPLATLVLLLAGLLFEGVVGFVFLMVVAVFLGWLLVLSWSAVTASGRLLRLAAVVAVAVAAVLQLQR